MATIDYPTSLPGPRVSTFRETSLDPWVSDNGAVGAPRRRKRFTRALKRWSFELLLTSEQRADLVSFHDDDLDDGVSEFNWTAPDGVEREVRFSERPTISDVDAVAWTASISLEEI